MNILYIEHYAGSDQYGMEFRPFYMAREWVKMGHSVTILAADFSHLRKVNPVVEKDFTEELDSGVRFVWLKTNKYRRNDHMRIFNILGFLNKVKKHAKFIADTYAPDVIIHSSTYPMDVYAAQAIKAHCGAPCFYEIHDLWPMSLTAMASWLSEKNPLIRYVQKAEDACYTLDDGVVSILPGALRHIEERGFTNVNYHNVPNGVVLGDMPAPAPLPDELTARFAHWKAQGKFVLLYAGGHARSNALDCLIQAADLVDASVQIVLVGKGEQKERLIELAKGKENVTFLPPVEKNQIPSLLALGDALYLGAKDDPLYTYGVGMNKIFDYMLAAKPVINSVRSAGNPMELSGCALTIPPEDGQALAAAVDELRQKDPAALAEMGQKGYEYVIQNHEYTVLAQQFIDALTSARKGNDEV
ncbi:MAG: glycosyltransferase family 4 protein [Clostridia bacterium]|nr:glycosyltransferase family 4 protein [Clostridia bacterium]